jgi:hypothetical protein
MTQFNIEAGIGIDTANGSGIGTILFDGDRLRQAMQVKGVLQVAPCCCQDCLGGE